MMIASKKIVAEANKFYNTTKKTVDPRNAIAYTAAKHPELTLLQLQKLYGIKTTNYIEPQRSELIDLDFLDEEDEIDLSFLDEE